MVEIIPKPPEKPPIWLSILFYISIGLFVGSVLSFFLLNYLQGVAKDALSDMETALQVSKTPEEQTVENKVLQTQKKINDFVLILGSHQKNSDFFSFFEGKIHPQVKINSFDLKKPSSLSLSGETENFVVLGQQLSIFQNTPQILKTNLSSLSLGTEGGVDFTFQLELSPKLFQFQ